MDSQRVNPTCPACGKICYRSRKHAHEVARSMGSRVRVYQCSGSWHFANADKATKRTVKRKKHYAYN